MPEYYVAWWNLENLFDVENAPNRSDKLARTLKNELKGWDNGVLTKKISQLAKIISMMNSNNGPDVLGVCEVENKNVLRRLKTKLQTSLGRSYSMIHADTRDERGIDVAFLYDPAKLEVIPKEVFFHFIIKRVATRDIVQVNFKCKPSNRKLIIIGNHWPSRSGGQLESEPYRVIAGETLSYFQQRIQGVHGKDTPVLVMGDFNDEPFNLSITNHAMATGSATKVRNARTVPYLYNLMWEMLGSGTGTFYFNSVFNVLDQFMISKAMITQNAKMKIGSGSVRVEAFAEMKNKNGSPRRFGRPSKESEFDLDGYSDHFPISVTLLEN